MSKEDFKKWVESSHRKTKPFAEYKGVKFSLSGGSKNFTEEEQKIIETAKTGGFRGKAPNGKVSNLNRKQWAQVRTDNFKILISA